jgi:N-acetylneuraminate synthase
MTTQAISSIGNKQVGDGLPSYIIAEIGINHNGSLELAKLLIDGAVRAGADAVKFQKRTPELCVPKDQWLIERDTPWGRMTYIDYRHYVEFGEKEYAEIDRYCKEKGIHWFASCWDEPSVDFIEKFNPPAYKVPSASLTDVDLLRRKRATGKVVILSTGMSTMEEIETAVDILGTENLIITHATSTYPCSLEELNLNMIGTLKAKYPTVPIGYSGHETGLAPTVAAVAMGAAVVERHVTLDRAMWGTDQAASVEIGGLSRLIEMVRDVERAKGDGIKHVYESELGPRKKLRKHLEMVVSA